MTWNIFLFEMHYLLLFHAHWHEINLLEHKKKKIHFSCLFKELRWGRLIHSQRLVISMLLRGFDYSLWESHDPKFNVHPETESDSFLKCSDITRGNYSCGHGCALRDVHHGFFCSCEDPKYKLDSFSSAVSNQKTRDTTHQYVLVPGKGGWYGYS